LNFRKTSHTSIRITDRKRLRDQVPTWTPGTLFFRSSPCDLFASATINQGGFDTHWWCTQLWCTHIQLVCVHQSVMCVISCEPVQSVQCMWQCVIYRVACFTVLFRGALHPVCTSNSPIGLHCLRPRRKFNQNWSKTAEFDCFGPVLIECSARNHLGSRMCKRAGMNP
jgi:hypothetical protein